MAYIISNDNVNGYSRADFISALAAKQDVLVSGENIKTINNHSVLGGGNLDVKPRAYIYDLNTVEQGLYDDAMTTLASLNPNGDYVTFGFISDLHTMPTNSEIQAADDIEVVVADILAGGINLKSISEGQTIAGQIKATYPTNDASYYGASSRPSMKLLGAIANDFGIDAVFCGGDLSSGRLPYNTYAYMLEKVYGMFDEYISVPFFFIEGNHDYMYDSSVPERSGSEWIKYQDRFNAPRGLETVYVRNIAEAVAYGDSKPLLGYYVNIDKGGKNRVRFGIMSNYEGQVGTSMNYVMHIADKNAADWTLCTMEHTNPAYLQPYYEACLKGVRKGTGGSTGQHTFPVMNNGVRLGALIGHIVGHIHQSLMGRTTGDIGTTSNPLDYWYHTITVSNAYSDNSDTYNKNNANGYCFSIFVVDTDNWWLYEYQPGRHPRNDANYTEVEGMYEKVSDGLYRYKIFHQ